MKPFSKESVCTRKRWKVLMQALYGAVVLLFISFDSEGCRPLNQAIHSIRNFNIKQDIYFCNNGPSIYPELELRSCLQFLYEISTLQQRGLIRETGHKVLKCRIRNYILCYDLSSFVIYLLSIGADCSASQVWIYGFSFKLNVSKIDRVYLFNILLEIHIQPLFAIFIGTCSAFA